MWRAGSGARSDYLGKTVSWARCAHPQCQNTPKTNRVGTARCGFANICLMCELQPRADAEEAALPRPLLLFQVRPLDD